MFFPALTRRPPASAPLARPVRPLHARCRRALFAAAGCASLLIASLAGAQTPGMLDTTFTSTEVGGNFYALTFEEVLGVQYLFVGGDNGLAERELASNGALDKTFTLEDFGLPTQRVIYTAVQEVTPTGGLTAPKVLVGGLFGRNSDQIVADEPGQNIKRFVAGDGTLDTDFNPGTGANNFVTSILPLADGSMVVGGEFTLFNKIAHQRIVKLDNSGAIVDSSVFDPSLGFDATVLSLAPQYAADGSGQNGQILVAGAFSSVSGQGHAKLARINADGSVDASFTPVFDDQVRIVVSQPDGKILAGGDFLTVNGLTEKHLVRLNYDGSVDTTFSCPVTSMPPLIAAPVAVNTITPLGDGRYYIGGNFAKIDGVTRSYLGRVLADGSVDAFDPGNALSNTVQQVLIDPMTNEVYVSQNRDKSINNVYPASVFRFFGDPPGVAIAAAIATASPAQPGVFTVKRTDQDTSSALRVFLTRGGTAKYTTNQKANGDYKLAVNKPTRSSVVNGQKIFFVTIPAGVEAITIEVIETATARAGTTVTLTLQPEEADFPSYELNGETTSTVTLE